MNPAASTDSGRRRTTLLLAGLALGMFAFGFAMVPLYNLLCQVTGVQSIAIRNDIGPTGGRHHERMAGVRWWSNSIPASIRICRGVCGGRASLTGHSGKMYEVIFRQKPQQQPGGWAGHTQYRSWQATPILINSNVSVLTGGCWTAASPPTCRCVLSFLRICRRASTPSPWLINFMKLDASIRRPEPYNPVQQQP